MVVTVVTVMVTVAVVTCVCVWRQTTRCLLPTFPACRRSPFLSLQTELLLFPSEEAQSPHTAASCEKAFSLAPSLSSLWPQARKASRRREALPSLLKREEGK